MRRGKWEGVACRGSRRGVATVWDREIVGMRGGLQSAPRGFVVS